MSLAPSQDRLRLPESLRMQLLEFRRRVWSIKMAEAACAAVFGIVLAYLAMFAVDRFWDTPGWLRLALFSAVLAAFAMVPLAAYRWVYRNRRLEQLARLLGRKHPQVGDQLLGVIELVESDSEQARSRELCEAAVRQVADDAKRRNFRDAVPTPRLKLWSWMAGIPAALAAVLLLIVPAAAANSWVRLLAPWGSTPRYTFAALEPFPSRLIVAHGEPFTLTAILSQSAAWRPNRGVVQLGKQAPVVALLRDGHYEFEMPPQLDASWLNLRIGDSLQTIRVEPMTRPELTALLADVTLPGYLGLPGERKRDVRGGTITLVKGSRARFAATASRELKGATVGGTARVPSGARLSSQELRVEGPRTLEFRWQDVFGLSGKEPFTLAINGRDDEAPALACEDLPRQKVVLDSELLNFKVKAQDDFGVKRVGLEWQGAENPLVKEPAKGERILAAGSNDREMLEANGTFSAKALGIAPQPIRLRVFVEDYFPGRARVYSPPSTLFILTPEQHAIWITEQMNKWHRQSLEVRDRELQLHETNKELRALSTKELDQPENRRRIENQASAEQANGRRLSGLVMSGDDLVRQAMRNPEIGVGHLEKWAEMLQVLKDISGNRMPSVASMLKQAAQAPSLASASPTKSAPMAGQVRDARPGKPSEPSPSSKPNVSAPQVVDRESSQQPPSKDEAPPAKKKPGNSRLTLPVTTIAGSGKTPPQKNDESPAQEELDQAVEAQRALLAEFDKIADELNKVLANLEGSTLVKRLKAASRLQYTIAGRINEHLGDAFGVNPARLPGAPAQVLDEMTKQEVKGSREVSLIMDDMQAYFERRRLQKFKGVLDEMKTQDVVGSLRQLGDDFKSENGLSIAQCEFWSDTLDRWADDLVDPSNCGACPGSKSKSSLPPSVVLEVLQILEAEVNLREETRVTEQAKGAITSEEYDHQALALSQTQKVVEGRVEKVTDTIRALPDGPIEFAREIGLLTQVAVVMNEATEILARLETGAPAIAAETEAIELLLQSKRINPKAGGGGGSTPGGGGGGTTQDSALALIGGGVNDKEVRENRGISQATGDSGPVLPEEFRAGLDEYFNRLERRPGGQ